MPLSEKQQAELERIRSDDPSCIELLWGGTLLKDGGLDDADMRELARAMIKREGLCVCTWIFFPYTRCVVVCEHHLFKRLKQQRLALADGLNKVWPNPNNLPRLSHSNGK